MKRQMLAVIEAARSLQVNRIPTEDEPEKIRIDCPRLEFGPRLYELASCLEDFDRAGGTEAAMAEVDDPAMDAARLRVCLDQVFRWMRAQGVDVREPHSLVAKQLRHAPQPLPPGMNIGYRKPSRGGPINRLEPLPGEAVSLSDLAQRSRQAQLIEESMGAAAPSARGR